MGYNIWTNTTKPNKMANEPVWADGIRTFEKKSGQPDFVLGDMIIEPDALIAWCDANPDKLTDYKGKRQLKLNLTRAKDNANRVNVSVNTYRKPESNDPF